MCPDADDFDLPPLPVIEKGSPPDSPICGSPMACIDGDWACVDCNGAILGRRQGHDDNVEFICIIVMVRVVTGPFHPHLEQPSPTRFDGWIKFGDSFAPLAIIVPSCFRG